MSIGIDCQWGEGMGQMNREFSINIIDAHFDADAISLTPLVTSEYFGFAWENTEP
jgi:hypothetical protein